jgi:hypothetical protein
MKKEDIKREDLKKEELTMIVQTVHENAMFEQTIKIYSKTIREEDPETAKIGAWAPYTYRVPVITVNDNIFFIGEEVEFGRGCSMKQAADSYKFFKQCFDFILKEGI